MELYVADAFTTTRFSGNQAGVALLGAADFPAETLMRALAGELKHSETAFVKQTGEKAFHIRYFTPAEEVDLCGHATIAAFTVLRDTGAIAPGEYFLHTRSGDLEIGVGENAVWMDMASPRDGRTFDEAEQAELYAAYGLTLADRPAGLEPQAVSTGLMDILLPVKDLETLDRAVQNEAEVTRLSQRYDVVGVHMFCPNTPDAAAHCRNFAPLYAIPEEAATGTSNGALTYYLYRRGLIQAGADNRFVQGEKMGKPSEILSRITGDGDGVKVRVGGRALITLKCELITGEPT
ncbi:PhzF family phenazine biosynthesis protein [Intestinimonas massiliensis (ex Afouda et al. 2020)]|uniref:PhzF family phenazine biosynthesis protein n=1 Tax=Intestinimonas massiliensis (ex Afouda et al. 2020) TaxID=1673721 RepID=UPI001030400B|nr:PhzF family phenazine biosynthesis protein [Intestinimonas massiliensis (ex Afouda et al. 2020)]